MAPSFDIGTPQRSLVRIPGSGSDKTLKPICLDVAQITKFCKLLTEIMVFDFNSSQEQTTGGTLSILQVPLSIPASVRPSLPSPANATNLISRKRSADQDSSGINNVISRKRLADQDHSSGITKRTIRENELMTVKERTQKLKCLELERTQLLTENADLARKVAMFKDILRNRTKLNEFLQALEELSC